jgi:hypothetical protein
MMRWTSVKRYVNALLGMVRIFLPLLLFMKLAQLIYWVVHP